MSGSAGKPVTRKRGSMHDGQGMDSRFRGNDACGSMGLSKLVILAKSLPCGGVTQVVVLEVSPRGSVATERSLNSSASMAHGNISLTILSRWGNPLVLH